MHNIGESNIKNVHLTPKTAVVLLNYLCQFSWCIHSTETLSSLIFHEPQTAENLKLSGKMNGIISTTA